MRKTWLTDVVTKDEKAAIGLVHLKALPEDLCMMPREA